MGIEVFFALVGKVEFGVEVTVVFEEEVGGMVGLHFVREMINVKDVGLFAVAFVDEHIVELAPGFAEVAVGDEGRDEVHESGLGFYVQVGQVYHGVPGLEIVEAGEG